MPLISFHDSWSDPADPGRCNVVFSGRTRQYGAYQLRIGYSKNLLRALCVSLFLVLASVAVPRLLRAFKTSSHSTFITSEAISLADPPSIDKLMPPPPVLIIPPPVQRTIRFTPPKIVRDEIADDPPPTQEEMQNIQVSTVTQEGTDEVILPVESPVAPPEEDKIFTIVEEMPSYPGGEKKMIEFILTNVHYPPVALENNITGKVYVKFMVDKDGKISNTELLKGIGGGCDEEAIRILKLMPDWIPGRQNGNKVKVGGMVLHIDFTLR
jgi:periplasmic protein TonB